MHVVNSRLWIIYYKFALLFSPDASFPRPQSPHLDQPAREVPLAPPCFTALCPRYDCLGEELLSPRPSSPPLPHLPSRWHHRRKNPNYLTRRHFHCRHRRRRRRPGHSTCVYGTSNPSRGDLKEREGGEERRRRRSSWSFTTGLCLAGLGRCSGWPRKVPATSVPARVWLRVPGSPFHFTWMKRVKKKSDDNCDALNCSVFFFFLMYGDFFAVLISLR